MRITLILVLSLSCMLCGACAVEPPVPTYQPYETGTAFGLDYGEVLEVRVVSIEGKIGVIGTWGGATAGRAVGVVSANTRNTRIIGGAIGGIAGAVAGRAIERKIREDEALEITVQLDGGEAIVVVQVEDIDFEPGDRVRVVRGRDGSARVSAV